MENESQLVRRARVSTGREGGGEPLAYVWPKLWAPSRGLCPAQLQPTEYRSRRSPEFSGKTENLELWERFVKH